MAEVATCRCGARWTGKRASHCGGCHETLGSVTGFDRHRRGGACLDPAAVGLARDARGTWRLPPAETHWTGAAGTDAAEAAQRC